MTDKISLILRLRAWGWVFNLTRLNIILLIITMALLYSPQGHDLLLSIVEDSDKFVPVVGLLGGTLLWAFSIWLWARVLLDIKFPDAPVSNAILLPARKHLPRALVIAAFLIVIVNLYSALDWHFNMLMLFLVLEGLLFYLFIYFRRPIGRWLAERFSRNKPKASWLWVGEISPRPRLSNLYQALSGILGKIAFATLLTGVVLLIWGLVSPLTLGRTLNTPLMLMLWGATILPFGSLVTYWGNWKGIPVVIIGAALMLFFSCFNDNHKIRQLESDKDISKRPTVTATLQRWADNHCDMKDGKRVCDPFVLVATAGGGIRAAYWTGLVLGKLHDATKTSSGKPAQSKTKTIDNYLFAISGVSGGSVGATIYRTVAADLPPLEEVTSTIQEILGQDYLGPVAAGLLYPDRVQRFLPVAMLEDRAKVFEEGLEVGFADVLKKKATKSDPLLLDQSFLSPIDPHRDWPALFLNSAWSDNGRRIVGTTLRMNKASPCVDSGHCPAPLFKDLLETLGYDMRLSTAAHNSARFPYVSPAGSWRPVDSGKDSPIKLQRLQDGGLFENYGAETALEILQRAEEVIGKGFNPLVILISSDPTLPKKIEDFLPYKKPIGFMYEVRSTLHTLLTVRTGRGIEAATRLKRWALGHNDAAFAYFRMCADKGDQEPPLGWALSATAKHKIESYLAEGDECRRQNRENVNLVVNRIKDEAVVCSELVCRKVETNQGEQAK